MSHHRNAATLPRRPSLSNLHGQQQQHQQISSKAASSTASRSTLESGVGSEVRSKLQHTGGTNCRLHINNGSKSVVASAVDTSSSSSSYTGHHGQQPQPQQQQPQKFDTSSCSSPTSTVKRNPKAKLTTFCSPEAQIMESPVNRPRKSQAELIQASNNGPNETTTTSILMHHN